MDGYHHPKGETPHVHWDEVIIPFKFFDLKKIEQLDPMDSEGIIMHIASGKVSPRERRPYDPFTAWVTLAHFGLVEKGCPPLRGDLDSTLNREQRLEAAKEVLTDAELFIVETIAVPSRYRTMSAQALVDIIRTASDYRDRMWAACWLTLTGWTESRVCPFRESSETPSNTCSDLEEAIAEAYAKSIGVTGRDDVLGWRRVDNSPEVQQACHRLTICGGHYSLNGPPPYELMKETVPCGPGWKQVVRIVPDTTGYL